MYSYLQLQVKNIFDFGIKAVNPGLLVKNFVKPLDKDLIEVGGISYNLRQNVYIIGFGKAVEEMCKSLQGIQPIENHLVKGILSVPLGSKRFYLDTELDTKVIALEGAKDNLPDNDSLCASKTIYELVSTLSSTDLLFVLISGGGSALFTYPKPPVSLEDKLKSIKLLTSKAADIRELNTVRKCLSLVKGGGLAKVSKCQTITLILSDIVNDPIDLIASAPTIPNKDDRSQPLDIIEKYGLTLEMPPTAIEVLSNIDKTPYIAETSNIRNYIIGNNETALNACLNRATNLNYKSFILTRALEGEAKVVGEAFALLAKLLTIDIDVEFADLKLEDVFKTTVNHLNEIISEARRNLVIGNNICILSGGETTVHLDANLSGKGGRNQEMALAFSVSFLHCDPKDFPHMIFGSMGTDGIDGPTDAAGAVAYPGQVGLARSQNLDPVLELVTNNSYNFYSQFKNGQDHIKIGHTGTNVMDLQALLIVVNGCAVKMSGIVN